MAYLREKAGAEIARRVIRELYNGTGRVGRLSNSGHRRPDVTDEQLLFYTVFSYLIVYKPLTEPVSIIGVFHG